MLSCTPAERLVLVGCVRRPKKHGSVGTKQAGPLSTRQKSVGSTHDGAGSCCRRRRRSRLNVPPCVVLPAHPPHP